MANNVIITTVDSSLVKLMSLTYGWMYGLVRGLVDGLVYGWSHVKSQKMK